MQQQQLRAAAREAQRQVKNAKKKRNRVLTRLRNLDTPSVLAVLMDRMANPAGAPSQLEAAVAAAASAGVTPDALAESLDAGDAPPAPESPADAVDSEDRDGTLCYSSPPGETDSEEERPTKVRVTSIDGAGHESESD